MSELTCFKAYDIRGEIGVNIDEGIAYRIGRAVAQHFGAQSVVIGFDARETSPAFAAAAARGAIDAGADVLDIGMAGTEEMYWAVTEFGACAGIEVTASHNPINYNGMKIVKSGSQPLDDAADFQVIKALAELQDWASPARVGETRDVAGAAREKYAYRVLGFVDVATLAPLKIVINSGNGAAGPTVDAITRQLAARGAPIEVIRVHHDPDSTFPNGIPNPCCPKITRSRRMWCCAKALIWVWPLTGTLTAASSLMGRVGLFRGNMWWASWPPSSWTKKRVAKSSTTRA